MLGRILTCDHVEPAAIETDQVLATHKQHAFWQIPYRSAALGILQCLKAGNAESLSSEENVLHIDSSDTFQRNLQCSLNMSVQQDIGIQPRRSTEKFGTRPPIRCGTVDREEFCSFVHMGAARGTAEAGEVSSTAV